jgi:DNA-binding CsgD family transcriptional regulator
MIDIDAFSQVVLDLQQTAQSSAPEQFDERALELVTRIIDFDMAWWGIMSRQNEGFILHWPTPFHLPSSFVPLWEEVNAEDMVAIRASRRPRTTVFFDKENLAETPGLAALTGEHGIAQAFCTSIYLPSEKAFAFLSLYRRSDSARFTDDERLINQHLMPHLCCSRKTNHLCQSKDADTRISDYTSSGIAVIDRQGNIIVAEREFWSLHNREWPASGERRLSSAVLRWIWSDDSELKMPSVVLHKHPFGQVTLVSLRERVASDLLTSREASIAQAYADGRSYKEIARDLGISPATARAHIRAIYSKLDVQHKGGLTSRIRDGAPPPGRDELMRRYRRLML